MIDIKKARIEYKQYVDKYTREGNPKILSKVRHMNRVADNSKIIAQSLNLDEEHIELAELIGLLHDIGRFEQLRIYDTYLDYKSIDHAKLGVKILFEDGYIRKFVENQKYDNVIYKAIWNHNKYKIEDGLTDEEQMHCKIIRDADKLDIYNIIANEGIKNHTSFESEDYSKEKLSDEIYKDFVQNRVISYSKMKTNIDHMVAWLGYAFDINYDKSFEIIKQEKYISKIVSVVDYKDNRTREKMNELAKITNEYVETKQRTDNWNCKCSNEECLAN